MVNYPYYNYLKKYDQSFLKKYEVAENRTLGRGSGFLNFVRLRSALFLTPRVFVFGSFRTKSLVYYIMALFLCADLWGIWYFQEIYYKYNIHKWTGYQPWFHKDLVDKIDVGVVDPTEEKKPFTRAKYADKIKIVYDGEDTPSTSSGRRYRYR